MNPVAYLLIGLFIIVVTPKILEQIKNQKHLQTGGANQSPHSFYTPILPTGHCNVKNTPGLTESSLYTSKLPRSLNFSGRAQDNFYSSESTPTHFNPPCLTKKPYGNAMATYNYWKYLPNLLEAQYVDCDKYMCANHHNNGYTALPSSEPSSACETLACDMVNQDYYNSSEDYCRKHPHSYPCPNWWMKNPEQIADLSRPGCGIKKLPKKIQVKSKVPRKANPWGFCLSEESDCQINDGKGYLMISRGREDQALC